MRVTDVMTREPVSLRASDTIGRAFQEMALGAFRHLPVVDESNRLVGLVSHSDLVALGPEGPARRVREVMRTDLETVGPLTEAHQAAYLMLRDRIGCVPVTGADGELLGIVTDTDFVRVAFGLLNPGAPFDTLIEEEAAAEIGDEP